MTIALDAGLPQPLSATTGEGGQLAQRRHGSWRQAMEQAQLAEWFKPLPESPAGTQERQRPHPESRTTMPTRESGARPAEARAPVRQSAGELAVRQALRSDSVSGGDPVPAPQPDRSPVTATATGTAPQGHDATTASFDLQQLEASIAKLLADPQEIGQPQPVAAIAAATLPSVASAAPLVSIAMPGEVAASVPALALRSQAPLAVTALPLRDPVSVPSPRAAPGVAAAPTEPAEVEAPRAVAPRAPPVEPPPPVRVHVDWLAQGAHVWLGVDRDSLPSLDALVRQLEQRLQAAGLRLITIVCNGRPVYPRSTQGEQQ